MPYSTVKKFEETIAQGAKFELKRPSADSLYYKQLEQICENGKYKIKFIKDIFGVHI